MQDTPASLIACVRRLPLPQPARVVQLPVHAIGTVAAYWTIDRVATFLG